MAPQHVNQRQLGGVVESCGLCLVGDLVNFDSGVAGNLVLGLLPASFGRRHKVVYPFPFGIFL